MTSMKCVIPGVNLRVFGRAIQSLSKIGDELYFEPLEDGLYLRSVNSCRSAYACFQFSPSFFLNYINGSVGGGEDLDEEPLRCKVGMKSIMTVFRSLATIDKMVEKCCISLNMSEARLVFQMYCRHGIVKTHNLAFIECETLQAVFSKDMCPNKFTSPPKLLCDAVLNFQNTQEEITLIVRPDFVALKNYVEDEPDPKKVMHTEFTLSPNEFENYQIGVDTDVTFCLKELRAILAFADITGLPITLQFEGAGKPITLSINSDLSFEANFVLATLADDEPSQMQHYTQTKSNYPSHSTTRKQSKVDGRNSVTNRNTSNASRSINKVPKQSVQPETSNDMNDSDDDDLTMAMMDVTAPDESVSHNNGGHQSSQHISVNSKIPDHRVLSNKNVSMETNVASGENDDDEEWGRGNEGDRNIHNYPALSLKNKAPDRGKERLLGDLHCAPIGNNLKGGGQNLSRIESTQGETNEMPHSTMNKSNNLHEPTLAGKKKLSLKSASSSNSDVSPVISLQDQNLPNNQSLLEELEEDEDDIPPTPPSKKFRSVFFGTQSSTQPSQSQPKFALLAPDSDEDS
ncbi:unnamed protein product [Lymnaea stagnalis]|uniref:Cell cycle checkpoint control protein RAD9A n=1 Tax=Lymnaea stagnalis TaxID=6523 RepID=A0AAV2HSG7_LYMST